MEVSGVSESSGGSDVGVASYGHGSIQPRNSLDGCENLGDDLLDDLDSYLEDINDRLTISRMVSDSIIKGMVNAVTEEATERIRKKEEEVALLKERLQFYETGSGRFKDLSVLSVSDTSVLKDGKDECLGNLKIEVEEKFQKLSKDIEDIKGVHSIGRLSSDSKLRGSDKWLEIDESLSDLKNTVMNVYEHANNMVYLSNTSICEWKQEREFQEELETIVLQSSIRSLQDQFEAKLWEQKSHIHRSQSENRLPKIIELSSLRQELDAISKSLSSSETGLLLSHGSIEGSEEKSNMKRKDHFQRKVLSTHVSPSNSLTEGNGKHEDPNGNTIETMDSAHLKRMSTDELINYFKAEMTKMKRNNESVVHELTEKYYSLRREFLKERDPYSPLKKEKEFESLRKKIPQVIFKLDNILMESGKVPVVYDDNEKVRNLNDRVDKLLSENRQLQDSLARKKKEVKYLSSRVSDAANRIRHHSLTEENLFKQVRKLKCDIEDTKIEFLVREEVYKCVLMDCIGKIRLFVESSHLESVTTKEICETVTSEAVSNSKVTVECGVEDSDIESISTQEMLGIIFMGAIKDAEASISLMQKEYEKDKEKRVFLEASLLNSQKELSLEIEENGRLKQELLFFSASIEEKEKFALEAASTLSKEKERFDLTLQELNRLRDQVMQKDRLISESMTDSNLLRSKLDGILHKMHLYEEQISKLDQKLKSSMKDLNDLNEEKRMLRNTLQEKEDNVLLLMEKETEHNKQIKAIITTVQKLSYEAANFESRTLENVRNNTLRLENLNLRCSPLLQKVNLFSRMELVYKQKLDRKYSDLQKAEAEVDLLGDEVDALLSLLEKIYVALEHYSPILQHYPGIMELLKLVRRELSGETTKPV